MKLNKQNNFSLIKESVKSFHEALKKDAFARADFERKALKEDKATEKPDCSRCNDNGCPACDEESRGSKYNPEPY